MAFLNPALTARVKSQAAAQAALSSGPQPFVSPVSNGHYDSVLGSVRTLNRKVWDDYYQNYQGRENKAYGQAFDTDFVGEAQGRADAALTAADGAGQASAQDMLTRYGQAQAGDQQAATRALTQLDAGARRIGTRNAVKWDAQETQEALQDQMLNDYTARLAAAIQNSSNVGQEAAQLKAAAIVERARKKKRRKGALTAALGVIAAPFTGGASLALTAGGLSAMG